MAANILFLYNNLVDSATSLTGSSEATGFLVENVKHPFRTKVWTTEGATAGDAYLDIDHGSAKNVDCIALANYDWVSAPGTLDLYFDDAADFSSVDHVEALTWAANPTANGNRGIIIKYFATQGYRYNRLRVVYAPGAVPTDWSLGRIFIGMKFEPTHTCLEKDDIQFIDESEIMIAPGGQRHVDEKALFRGKRFSFLAETQAQWEAFQAMINHVGIFKNLFIAFDYDNEPDEMTWYGYFNKALKASNDRKTQFKLDFDFIEAT